MASQIFFKQDEEEDDEELENINKLNNSYFEHNFSESELEKSNQFESAHDSQVCSFQKQLSCQKPNNFLNGSQMDSFYRMRDNFQNQLFGQEGSDPFSIDNNQFQSRGAQMKNRHPTGEDDGIIV